MSSFEVTQIWDKVRQNVFVLVCVLLDQWFQASFWTYGPYIKYNELMNHLKATLLLDSVFELQIKDYKLHHLLTINLI